MKAYITLLSNEAYLPGVKVLHKSLKSVGAQYPLVCALSLSIGEDVKLVLEKEGIPCVKLTRKAVEGNMNPCGKSFSHWNYTFDKLLIWGLEQFDKLVFLDSDMLVVRNIDHLFEKEAFSSVCAGRSYPGNEHWTGLNSGLMVIEPDKNFEFRLLNSIDSVVKIAKSNNQLVGDQDVLKYVLSDWVEHPNLHLDEGYNLFADHLTYYIKYLGYSLGESAEKKPIYVIHFIGKAKPWIKKNLRVWVWLLKMRIENPFYYHAYQQFTDYMK